MELRKKLKNSWKELPQKSVFWVHVSSGEFEYAKPVIRHLKAHLPGAKIVVSYFSPSVKKSVENFEIIDGAFPLPLDTYGELKPLFQHFKPQAILISRTDLWPEFIYLAHKFKVPVYLFSTTLNLSNSKLKSVFSRSFYSWLLNYVTQIWVVSESDKAAMELLAPSTKIGVLGDSRFDQVLYRIRNPISIPPKMKPKNFPTLVCGSTWKADETVIFEALHLLKDKSLSVIIAPHEPTPEHIENLKNQAEELGIPYSLWSEQNIHWADQAQLNLLIIDTVGILAELYAWGQWAFVGNSFEKNAIHSVMEPLGQGLLTFVGPYHSNNREALEFQHLKSNASGEAFVQEVASARALAAKIEETFQISWGEFRFDLKKVFETKAGASQKIAQNLILKSLLRILDKTRNKS